jgi:hypothetical protein
MCRSIFQLAQHPGPAYLALADSIETAIRAGDVVQVLVLANPDGRFALGVDGLERGQIGSAFINRHRLRGAVLIDRLYICQPRILPLPH